MAIALTPFTALCGFRPLPQIAKYLQSTPEYAALVPSTTILTFLDLSHSPTPTGATEKATLRDVFEALMTAKPEDFQPQLEKLVNRYKSGDVKDEEKDMKDLVLRLESQFPGDIGVFCAFILNYVVMEPGEAIFLGAGEPHAYVSGGKCTRTQHVAFH
jgi:mannose-6-phosphate isomerase